jgi:hypothetical protein
MKTLPVISILVAIILCGCSDSSTSRQPSVATPESTTPEPKPESKPSVGTVENLLASVAGITNGQTSFELFVPAQLTHNGEPIQQGAAMAIVLDKILGHGLLPVGSEQRSGGSFYKYEKE